MGSDSESTSSKSSESKASKASSKSKSSKASSKASKASKVSVVEALNEKRDDKEIASDVDEKGNGDHAVELSDSDSDDDRKAGSDADEADNQPAAVEEESPPVAKTKDLALKIARRDRAFFGRLVGHLDKAKLALENDKSTEQRQLQRSAELRIIEQLRKDRANLELKRRQEEAKRRHVEREGHLLNKRLEKHYWRMTNFIRTQAEPTIFFLPKKHNEQTLAHLADTKKAIERKLMSLKKKDFCNATDKPMFGRRRVDDTATLEKGREAKRRRANSNSPPRRQ